MLSNWIAKKYKIVGIVNLILCKMRCLNLLYSFRKVNVRYKANNKNKNITVIPALLKKLLSFQIWVVKGLKKFRPVNDNPI